MSLLPLSAITRMMIAAAASEELHMEQMDVTTAFLYAALEEEVYSEIPEGMFATEIPGKVLRLWLYGLKQSPRMWNLHIDKALLEFGLHRLTTYICVYAAFEGANRVLLGLFVDDMMMIGKLLARIGQVKEFLHSKFKMKDPGAASFLLGWKSGAYQAGTSSCCRRSTSGRSSANSRS